MNGDERFGLFAVGVDSLRNVDDTNAGEPISELVEPTVRRRGIIVPSPAQTASAVEVSTRRRQCEFSRTALRGESISQRK